MASNADKSFKPAEEKKGKKKRRPPPPDSKQPSHHPNNKTGSVNIHLQKVGYLQVGNNNTMIVNPAHTRTGPYTRSQGKQTCTEIEEIKFTPDQHSRLTQLQDSLEDVDSNLMAELSKSWGRCWRKYGKMLNLDDTALQNIEDNVRQDENKTREVSFQVLLSWKKTTEDPSVKNLINLLTLGYNDYSAIKDLITSNNYWKN